MQSLSICQLAKLPELEFLSWGTLETRFNKHFRWFLNSLNLRTMALNYICKRVQIFSQVTLHFLKMESVNKLAPVSLSNSICRYNDKKYVYIVKHRFHTGGKTTYRLSRWLSGKESTSQCRRPGFHPLSQKIPWRRKWQPIQYSCLGKCMDRGAWQTAVHGVTKSWTWLSD